LRVWEWGITLAAYPPEHSNPLPLQRLPFCLIAGVFLKILLTTKTGYFIFLFLKKTSMSGLSNSVQAISEQYGDNNERKKLTRKLFAAYVNEQLINTADAVTKPKNNGAINTFDNTDLFYLLSLAEKLPAYGVGFSDDSIHDVN
jgi:hypothetical protein